MATGIVVLGPCPPLMRDVLRALLREDPGLEVVEGELRVGAGTRVVAHVVVGERAGADAMARAIVGGTPVVVVASDGRWAGRYVGGRLEREVEEVSAKGVRELVHG